MKPSIFCAPAGGVMSSVGVTRRQFLRGAAAVSVAGAMLGGGGVARGGAETAAVVGAGGGRKIKLGLVGAGGRGGWIARLFAQHGGYELWAVADYFQSVADACGDALGVDKGRRFAGLKGYERVLESGVEAVALETPPYFFPGHVRAAVEAGVHVYMAKPVAVDVPGCLEVEAAAATAGAKGRCFLVDYQIPTDPANVEVMKWVQEGELGPLAVLNSRYYAGTFADPPLGETVEDRLQRLVWVNDVALGGGYHVNACIHAVDALLWVAGARPVSAAGISRRMRPEAHGDSHDVFSVLFEFPGGLVADHRGKHLNNQTGFDVACEIHGQKGHAQIGYNGRATLKSGENACNGAITDLYEAGAVRNIATFYRDVVEGRSENGTVRRSVDGCLATILGREAMRRRTRLTMEGLLRENRRWEVDLKGLR